LRLAFSLKIDPCPERLAFSLKIDPCPDLPST
jgi:hypothetical protein